VLVREAGIGEALPESCESLMVLEILLPLSLVGPARIDLAHVIPEHLREAERLFGRESIEWVRLSWRGPVALGVVAELLDGRPVHALSLAAPRVVAPSVAPTRPTRPSNPAGPERKHTEFEPLPKPIWPNAKPLFFFRPQNFGSIPLHFRLVYARGMVDKSIDFDRVARYYDAHVTTTVDLEFWVELCRRFPGPHLELMCGTGRISLALLRAGIPLTCVDYSAGLLARLGAKLAKLEARGLPVAAAELIEADVRELELDRRFGCVYIGFHAIAELTKLDDLRRTLGRIAALLAPGGVALISMHVPEVRGPQCDGHWVELGTHPLARAGTDSSDARVEVRGRWQHQGEDFADGLVTGVQVYVERDAEGREFARVELPVRFRLWAGATIEREAAERGLELRARHEGYGWPPRPASASSKVVVLELARA
jgi:SAM-dependent methyltransferase